MGAEAEQLQKAWRAFKRAKTEREREYAVSDALVACTALLVHFRRKYAGYRKDKGDEKDVEQVARLGVWSALETWKPDAGAAILGHTHRCVERKILDYLRAGRARVLPTVSLDAPCLAGDGEGDELNLHNALPAPNNVTEHQAAANARDTQDADALGCTYKQADNTSQSVLRRLRVKQDALAEILKGADDA